MLETSEAKMAAVDGIGSTKEPAENTNQDGFVTPEKQEVTLETADAQPEELEYDSDSDRELDLELNRKLRDGYQFGHLKSVEERKLKARRLAIQSHLYSQLVEDRIKELEKKIQAILNMPEPETLMTDEDILKPLPHDLSIHRMTWKQFSAPVDVPESMIRRVKWFHGLEVDGVSKNVIETLVEDPRKAYQPSWSSENKSALQVDPSSYTPYQLRFRSPMMLKLLERITQQKVMIGPHKHQILLFRPFKLLVAYSDEILSFLKQLENNFDGQESGNSDVQASHSTSDDPRSCSEQDGSYEASQKNTDGSNHNEAQTSHSADLEDDSDSQSTKEDDLIAETETKEALLHMRVLKELLTVDLGRMVELREGIDSGKARMVAFPDLWHVFRHGQEVLTPNQKQRQL
jgi:hypothetical protein